MIEKKVEENKINNTYKIGCQIQGFSENMKENLMSQLLLSLIFLKLFFQYFLSIIKISFTVLTDLLYVFSCNQ